MTYNFQYDWNEGYGYTVNTPPTTTTNTPVYTTTNTSTPVYTISTGTNGTSAWDLSTISVNPRLNGNTLSVQGDADFNGDIKVKGKSLVEAIENIEKRLAILHPNTELEEKWERLKSLGDMYRELEKEILEKEEIWKILQK